MLALLTGTLPGVLTTFVLEAVNRAITVAFKFVPLRLGVDEAGTELLTRTLSLPLGVGVTMAIVRKARVLSWCAWAWRSLRGTDCGRPGVPGAVLELTVPTRSARPTPV